MSKSLGFQKYMEERYKNKWDNNKNLKKTKK